MQPNELSNDLIRNIYKVLKECCSFELCELDECDIINKKWVFTNRKYSRQFECTCRYYPNERIISLLLLTDDWFMRYLFIYDRLNVAIQFKLQIEVEDILRNIISMCMSQIDNSFFEKKLNEKVVKKKVVVDIKSIYSQPMENIFEYENQCYMEIAINLLSMDLIFYNISNCIGFSTLEGSSIFTPFLSEDIISEHEILINRGYKKLVEDITRNYKNANEMRVANIVYKNDEYILKWFKSQIGIESLSNIFIEINQYIELTAQRKNVKNILKSIRQDLKKIFYTIENIFYVEDLEKKESENIFLKERKKIYQGIDVEFIYIKYRSIIDYTVELIKAIFPETEGAKLEGKFAYFSDVMKNNIDFDKYILSSNWFQSIKNIRDNVVHHGATCYIYNGKSLGFQMYDLDLNNLVLDTEEYMRMRNDDNVYRLDRYLVINLAYLYYFLNICFKAVSKKMFNQSNNKEQIKKLLKEQKESQLQLDKHYHMHTEIFGCAISNLLEEWCTDVLNYIEDK